MNISEVRLAKLKELINESGSQIKFSEAVDLAPAQVSALITGRRNIGEKLARNVESKLGLAPLSLDSRINAADDLNSVVADLNARIQSLSLENIDLKAKLKKIQTISANINQNTGEERNDVCNKIN